MEIVKTQIKVSVYGKDYELEAPKALEAAEFIDSIDAEKKLSNTEMISKTYGFLTKMGLPEDVCKSLELEHLNKLIEFITKKK
jgi:hypothetical protein